jgi:hypothetical protein
MLEFCVAARSAGTEPNTNEELMFDDQATLEKAIKKRLVKRLGYSPSQPAHSR